MNDIALTTGICRKTHKYDKNHYRTILSLLTIQIMSKVKIIKEIYWVYIERDTVCKL
jgi:hypothetical protein